MGLSVGRIGEDLACRFLVKRGYRIMERNYLVRLGEIDIIAVKKGIYYFIEVKTVSRRNIRNVSHETNGYRPEDNIHKWKLKRLERAVASYLASRGVSGETDWTIDAVVIYLDLNEKLAKINYIESIA